MELLDEILVNALITGKIQTSISAKEDIRSIVKTECYRIVSENKNIIANDDLDDNECFEKIERIVELFEGNGYNCGNRHDFG